MITITSITVIFILVIVCIKICREAGGFSLSPRFVNSGEAFCSFTLLYWIETDTNPGLLPLKKKEMGPNG